MNQKILVDSDAFYALINPTDPHHKAALRINKMLISQETQFVSTNLVLYEVATLLSYRLDRQTAIKFLTEFGEKNIEIYHVDDNREKETLAIFKKQTKKRISMVDCANMAVMKKFGIVTSFSFDEIYKRNGFKRARIDS